MLGKRQTTHPARQIRRAGAVVASAAVLGALAVFPAQGVATNTIKVGVGGSSIVVNGTTISTSHLTLAELAKLQGVPATTVQAELDGIALGTPAASAVEALVASLPLESTLASALDGVSAATGGAISPQTALADLIEDEGVPGASGANGGNGSNGGNGPGGSSGVSGAGAPAPDPGAAPAAAKRAFSLKAGSRSLKGHPGSRVSVRFDVSSAAKLSYSGRKLSKGSRKVKSGANVLTLKLPKQHGNYQLVLKALGPEGQSAQTTVALHDAALKKKARH
jgi:hypothetical protein